MPRLCEILLFERKNSKEGILKSYLDERILKGIRKSCTVRGHYNWNYRGGDECIIANSFHSHSFGDIGPLYHPWFKLTYYRYLIMAAWIWALFELSPVSWGSKLWFKILVTAADWDNSQFEQFEQKNSEWRVTLLRRDFSWNCWGGVKLFAAGRAVRIVCSSILKEQEL